MFCHCTALKRPVYHTSKWTGGPALGGEELVCSQSGEYLTAGHTRCNYWMKTNNFGKKPPQIHLWGADPHMHAAKAVGGTERCKIMLGLPSPESCWKWAIFNSPTCKTGFQREIEPIRLDTPQFKRCQSQKALGQRCTWGKTRWHEWLLSQLGTSRDSQGMAGYHKGSQGHPTADWHIHSWKWFEGHLM